MRRATIAKAGRTAGSFGFTGMARRRVRWWNVGRLACLAAAGVLIATHQSEPSAPEPHVVRAQGLPRLRDVPRLLLPRPRQRRALKGGKPRRKRGVRRIMRPYDAQDGKPPSQASGEVPVRAPPPSPQPGPVGQAAPPERSAPAPAPAPATGEFTPDPAP